MKRRKVRFTATAQTQIRQLKKWWRENAEYPEIPHEDLSEALEALALVPGIGSPYRSAPIPGVRRHYLERLTCHLYYTYDQDELIIRAVWHARRGSGPVFDF